MGAKESNDVDTPGIMALPRWERVEWFWEVDVDSVSPLYIESREMLKVWTEKCGEMK